MRIHYTKESTGPWSLWSGHPIQSDLIQSRTKPIPSDPIYLNGSDLSPTYVSKCMYIAWIIWISINSIASQFLNFLRHPVAILES